MARHGVRVIMHNTLVASDYGLLDPNTLEPRPNYWATLLWHKLMGPAVLDAHVSVPPDAYVYAQCRETQAGGVTLLVINANRQRGLDLNLPTAGERYTLTAKQLEDTTVELNGKPLRLTTSGDLPQFKGEATNAGRMTFAPTSITYLTIEKAGNGNCQ